MALLTDEQLLDLDALVGGEVRVKLGGTVRTFYATFSAADEAHRERIAERIMANEARNEAAQRRLRDYLAASRDAREAGEPPPVAPNWEELGATHPDFYSNDAYQRDVFNLLLSVWQKSEGSKPEHERESITPELVQRTFNEVTGWALLERLFPVRYAPRVAAPAKQAPADAAPPTSTAPARPNRAARRRPSGT